MNSHHLSTYARIALVATAVGFMAACAPVQHRPGSAPYYAPRVMYFDYWYYPAIGAYYDPRARIYIYFQHDHWIHARALPPHVRPYIGSHVIVRSPNQRPYQEYSRHREQYLPERYRKPDPAHRGKDIWIGPTRQPIPQRDRDDQRKDTRDQSRNGKDLGRDPKRGSGPVPPQYRAPVIRVPLQAPNSRPQDAPRYRESPAIAVPGEREDKGRQQEIRSEKLREQNRRTRPHNQQQPAKTQPQVVPGRHEPPASAAPDKQDKGRGHEMRKEDVPDDTRDRNDRRGNDPRRDDDDSSSENGQRRPSNQYEDYRQQTR